MSAFFFVLHSGGWRAGVPLATDAPLYLQGTTSCLAAIIVMQAVNAWLCRSPTRSLVQMNRGSPLIAGGVIMSLGLLVLIAYTPVGQALLDTAPLPIADWIVFLPFAPVLLILEEARKWLVRQLHPASRRTLPCA